jgi:hypothetical protein
LAIVVSCCSHNIVWWQVGAADFLLAYHPVVAELAAEVAAACGYRQYRRAWVKVCQRFLGDRVYRHGARFAVSQCVQFAVFVFSDLAEAEAAVGYYACSGAEEASYLFVGQW